MDGRERLLREFETLTGEIAEMERRLAEAKSRQDQLRRQLRAALRNGREATDESGTAEPPAATVEAVDAIRKLGEPVDAARVAELLHVTPSIARTRLQRATALGLLRRVKRGCYEVVPATH